MCDYSLHAVASRPAKVGDKLITTMFDDALTAGFASADEPNVAVCLRPGTELSFEGEIERRHHFTQLFPRFGFGKLGAAVARFRKINEHKPNVHHDAVELANGKVVLVTQLRIGQRATVLQLPATENEQRAGGAQHHDSAGQVAAALFEATDAGSSERPIEGRLKRLLSTPS
jgi:hypothetical protein